MATLIFVAAARGVQGAGYTASFPDLPQVAVQAGDLVELLSRSREAVRQELQRLTDEGQDWPVATPIERLALEPGVIPILVDVVVDDPAVRVNISMGERLLERVDRAAEAAGMSRSGFIAEAVRSALGDRRGARAAAELEAVAKSLQEEWAQLGRKITESLGPSSTFNRNLADLDARVSETVRKAAESVAAAMARRMEAEGRASGPDEGPSPDRTGPVN